jgi:hypothetical protein
MGWSLWDSEARVRLLVELWEPPNALSARAISARLGVSMSAVCGKSKRLNLTRRESPFGAGHRLPKLSDTLPTILGASHRLPVPRQTLDALTSVAGVKVAGVLPLSALRPVPGRVAECCWPISNGRPWLFCEAATLPGHRYCVDHRAISLFGAKKKRAAEAIGAAVRAAASASAAAGASASALSCGSPIEASTIPHASESTDVENANHQTSYEDQHEVASLAC